MAVTRKNEPQTGVRGAFYQEESGIRTPVIHVVEARALELYHNARTQRDEHIRAFEAEYGRADCVDHTLLADLQRTQARLAAIAARQQRSNASGAEPKVAKFVDQIGT